MRGSRLFVMLLILVVFMTLAVAEEKKTGGVQFTKDKTGYLVLSAETGKLEPVFWRKAYHHADCPFSAYENGKPKEYEVENCFDNPYMWGTVKGDHLELFPIEPGVMLGFPLEKVTRNPRESEWWKQNFGEEQQKNQAELTTQRKVLWRLIGMESKSDQELVELVAKDVTAGYGIDTPQPRSTILADVRRYTDKATASSTAKPPKK